MGDYKLSMYSKEELPTWFEMYNDFWKNKVYNYNIEDVNGQEMDMYWNVPRRKYILGVACNQLNKMIQEDGKLPMLIEFVQDILGSTIAGENNDSKLYKALDVKFLILNDTLNELKTTSDKHVNLPIYTFDLPTDKVNPFILNPDTRINLTHSNISLFLGCVIKYFDETVDDISRLIICPNNYYFPEAYNIMTPIIEFLMMDIIKYFKDDIGWKDE